MDDALEARDSVFYFTFHKCASTLFANDVLPNAIGLKHVDFAKQVYTGAINSKTQITFEDRGHIYGPIRISARPENPVRRLLVETVLESSFIANKRAVFLVRDPRDILVSMYFSFGFSHGLSPVKEVRTVQESVRASIQQQSIDEFVLERALEQKSYFEALDRLVRQCVNHSVLYYEEMISAFERFSEKLQKFIPLSPDVVQEIQKRSRPRPTEDPTQHKRSGRVGGFRDHLRPDTVQSLNRIFENILASHQYRP